MRMFANAGVLATFAGALVFVVLYARLTRGGWRASLMGRHVMTFMIVITTVSSLAVVAIFFGSDWPYRDLIRGLAWSAVAACVWWRVLLLRKVQREVPDDPVKYQKGKQS